MAPTCLFICLRCPFDLDVGLNYVKISIAHLLMMKTRWDKRFMWRPDILVIGENGQLGAECLSVMAGDTIMGVDFPRIDIADKQSLFTYLDRVAPWVIVNCAAYTAVDACESDAACWRINAHGPGYLSEWGKKNHAFLVHISTDYVFDGTKKLYHGYTEADRPAPLSEYGRSKLAGEQAVLAAGADAAILRTSWLYSASGNNFLKTIIRLAGAKPHQPIRVVNDQFGSPTWARTLARQIQVVIKARATGLFHATGEGFCSWYDLACRFFELSGLPGCIVPCSTAEYPTPARRPKNSILSNAALKASTLNVFESWEVALAACVDRWGDALIADSKKVATDGNC